MMPQRHTGPVIAVMQPYLYPYAGYFRLMAASDVFVILDDVQFMRRGRVHRCEMMPQRWLTLPLQYAPISARIVDLQWHSDARNLLDQRLRAYRIPRTALTPTANAVCRHLYGPLTNICDFLECGLEIVRKALRLNCRIIRSSNLDIDSSLHGKERVIAIVHALGGKTYVNLPGGKMLYNQDAFNSAGLALKFLPLYSGPYVHLLKALLAEDIVGLEADVRVSV